MYKVKRRFIFLFQIAGNGEILYTNDRGIPRDVTIEQDWQAEFFIKINKKIFF